jgi:hypothetical protein
MGWSTILLDGGLHLLAAILTGAAVISALAWVLRLWRELPACRRCLRQLDDKLGATVETNRERRQTISVLRDQLHGLRCRHDDVRDYRDQLTAMLAAAEAQVDTDGAAGGGWRAPRRLTQDEVFGGGDRQTAPRPTVAGQESPPH